MDDEATPEDRLEKFATAMEASDITAMPSAYSTSDPTQFVADVRAVVTKARAVLG
jgi:hypothetical protein